MTKPFDLWLMPLPKNALIDCPKCDGIGQIVEGYPTDDGYCRYLCDICNGSGGVTDEEFDVYMVNNPDMRENTR